MVFNLAGNLPHCKRWDHTILPSPYVDQPPAPTRLLANVVFELAAEADVKLDHPLLGGTNGHIDTRACVVFGAPWNWKMI